jgi:sugar/nucleoside kinase (ribokinase family)
MINPDDIKRSLLEKITPLKPTDLSQLKVLSMSDFIIDHTLYIDDFGGFLDRVQKIIDQGGGDLPIVKQSMQRGGCGAIAASGMNKLGMSTSFIGRTSPFGMSLLVSLLGEDNVNIRNSKTDGNLGLMTILEIGSDKKNVMIGDPESLSPLKYSDFSLSDIALLKSCNLVGIFNWALNTSGTDLARGVFRCAKGAGVTTYLDTGDPSSREGEIEELFDEVLSSEDLDILSVNENELNYYYKVVSKENDDIGIMEKAALLKKHIAARLDVHMAPFSASFFDDAHYIMPTYRVAPQRTTGAGDSWNAGNILGHLLNLPPEERLQLGNAVACYYISLDLPSHPSIQEVADYIAHTPFRELEEEYL